MPLDFNKLKKHEKYQEGTVSKVRISKNIQNKGMLNNNNVQKTLLATVNRTDNNTMIQRVQARYENIMRQTVDSTPNVKNNVPNVNVSQQMNANAGTGMRSTAKTGSVNDGKLPTLNSMPNKYEENKNVSKGRDRGLLKDTKNIASNFGLGIKKAGESAMYYMEEMSNRNRDYRIRNKFMSKLNQEKEQQENLKNGKTLEGKDVKQTLFPNIESIKQQLVNQPTNAVLERAQEVQNLESPISEFLNEKMAVDEGKIQQNIDSSSNPVSKKIAELMPSIGQSTTGMAVSAVNPGLGLAFWQTSAGGDYIKDAKARGMKEEDALKYGTIMGAMESATEWVGGELTKGVGKAISKGGTIEGLKALGLDIGENFFEEAIMEPIQETVATMTGGKETADWNDMMKRVLQSGIDGALTSIIMGGASAGVGKATSLIGKMQSGEKITQQEIADTLKEINKTEEIDIEKVLARAFGVNIKNNNIEIQKQNGEISNLFIDKNSSANELQREINANKQLDNKMQNMSSQIFRNEGMGLQNNEHLKDNQQITQPNNEIPQNGNMEQIQQNQNNLANNQEMLYNNTESESGVNEQVQREGMEGVLGELRTRIYEETSQSKEYSRTEYEQWEKSITPTEENRITESERKIRDNVKGQYQKDIVFFDGTENDLYSGGASYQDKNKIHVDRKQAENFGLNKMVYHEILESDILHNERLKEDIIKPTIQKIMDDPNFENQKQEFWKNETDNMPSDYLIAKDILCDRFSELKTNEKLDYENMLSQESNMTIDYALENFHQSLYGKDIGNSNESSFSMQENVVPIGENVKRKRNNLANHQEIGYNNTESEVDINGQKTGNNELLEQRNDTSIQQKQEQEQKQQRIRTKTEYQQYEKSIKEINNITENQQQIKDEIKNKYNKNIIYYSGNESDLFSGGASITDANTIYLDVNKVEEFGNKRMALHEVFESKIQSANEDGKDIVYSAMDAIMEDNSWENQKQEFWQEQDEEIPSDFQIAKDIICDRYAELNDSEELDYKNLLSQDTINKIDSAINYFEYNTKNSNESSFSMQENITDMYREEMNQGKNRKHYKTVFESEAVGKIGKQANKELFAKDTYVPVSNQKTITEVNDNIGRVGVENSYIAFQSKIANNEKINLQDIATGERLIQIYSQQGDYNKVQDLIQDVAILGTELGQQVQALSLIKKMSPEGQLQYLNKLVERTNIKEKADIKVTDEMAKKILESKSQEDLENNLTEVAIQIGEQIPITRRDKIRSWRYLSMLGNPKTHIKNIGANVAMNITQNVKNTMAAGMEDAVSVFNKNMERTKTLKHSTDEQIDFARQDAEYMKDLIDGGGKYDIKNIIQNNKKQFDNKTLNAIAKFNSNALDVEDKVFLKLAYSQALANYMTANKLNPSDMAGKTLEKARQYASFQAQEATFHQFSALANSLNAIENRGGVGGKFVEAVLPFKKTPLNIAKSGVEYSPIGIAKSLTFDLNSMWNQTDEYKSMLEQGKITQEEYNSATSKLLTKQIDNMAKGLTGTSIAMIGYFLAQSGILKAGNDGEDDEFEEKMGKQEYSIQIGDYTCSLDWISPSAIPLFVGATVQQLLNSEEEDKDGIINSALTAGVKAFEPMTEMSMLQSLTSAISSYEQGSSSMIFDLGTSAISSYVGQFVPTTLGQVARTMDPYERDTISTKKGMEKKVDQFVKQQMNKVPGLSQMLSIKQDVWGEDKKRDDNVGMRLLTNMILPYNRKKVIEDVTNTELLSVFEDTGEKGVLPGTVSKDLTINKEKYRLTAEEYKEAKKQFGSESKKILDGLIKSNSYKELSPEQRAKAIENVYSYTKENMKKIYADNKKIELKTSNVYNTVKRIEDENGKVSSYFEYHSQIDGMKKDSEKMKCLRNVTTDTKTKSIIYEEYLMNKPDEGEQTQYEKVKEDYGSEKIIDQYLDYKVKANDKLEVLRATGKKKKTEGLTDVESINLLKEAGYDKYQNEALYTNMIASDKNKMVYQYLKKINKGNCIDDYMTYLTSDIAADKTDNGLKNGKTVTGSASKKKGEAINKTNLNELAKIYLYATSNTVTNKTRSSDYNKLANYVHSLPDEEQKEILKTISSAKETTTGSYYWK